MKALLTALAVLVLASLGAASSASAATPPLRCLVLDNQNSSQALDVCKCVKVSVSDEILRLLKRKPLLVLANCGANFGGGGGSSESASGEPEHGHGYTFAKASSTSIVHGSAGVWHGSPYADTFIYHKDSAFVAGTEGEASATGNAGGVSVAASAGGSFGGFSGGLSGGSTGGEACAGAGCN